MTCTRYPGDCYRKAISEFPLGSDRRRGERGEEFDYEARGEHYRGHVAVDDTTVYCWHRETKEQA